MSVAKIYKQFSKLSNEERAELMDLLNDNEEVEQKASEQVVETQEPQIEDKKEVKANEEQKEVEEQPQPNQEPIQEPNPTPNVEEQTAEDFKGVTLDQVVLKEDLNEMLNAITAKLDSVIKENVDLKEKLANSKAENDEMHQKYEKEDFGNQTQKGYGQSNESSPYESADDYVKKFFG